MNIPPRISQRRLRDFDSISGQVKINSIIDRRDPRNEKAATKIGRTKIRNRRADAAAAHPIGCRIACDSATGTVHAAPLHRADVAS
jgi:hypothetical protein